MRLPEQADLVHGKCRKFIAVGIRRRHAQRMKIIAGRHRNTLDQAVYPVVVHQKADRSPVHAIDPLAGIHRFVENLQHEAIAAERHDHFRLVEGRVAVSAFQLLQRPLGLLG
ncbi:hypothetical protein D3C87_1470840 [compost metagenome]